MIYLIRKLNKKLVILTFDHLVIMVNISNLTNDFFINHKMFFLTSQIKQKFGQPKK